jgi:hypothetical protein
MVMKQCDVFLSMGESSLPGLLRHISISRLRTYQIYEHIKLRTRLMKLNNESLRKAAPRLWARLGEGDEDLATDLGQAILVSHLDMIIAALDLLGIPHQDGFFAKDANVAEQLTEGWQQRVYGALKEKHPPEIIVFYLNHLAAETGTADAVFQPA